jgi:hypothetical protein
VRRLLPALAVALVMLPAAGAQAHSTITIQGPDITYFSEDAVSDNCLTVDETATEIRFHDPCADSGVQTTQCRPGDEFDPAGNSVEAFCPRSGVRNVNIEVGPNEDKVTVNVAEIVSASGGSGTDALTSLGAGNDVLVGEQGNDTIAAGPGNDELNGGEGNDTLRGEAGNDKIQGAAGTDTIDSGDGDDAVTSQDGVADKVTCGGGNDTVTGDTADEVSPDCETANRAFVAPPANQPAADDKTRPKVAVGGSTLQKVSLKRRKVYVAATMSEKGELVASGFLDAGGINTPLKAKPLQVSVAGGGVEIAITLTKSQMKKVMRDLKRRKKVTVRINVVATDAAGNAANAKTFKIRLRK